MAKTEVLLVDDEPQIRFTLRRFLESRGYGILEAESCQSALQVCHDSQPDAIVLDHNLPDGDALSLLPPLQEIHPGVPIIVLTAYATVDLAVQAMKQGAEYFLTKPVDLTALQRILDRALENRRNRLKVAANESRLSREFLNAFLGNGPAITQLARLSENALRTDGPVLIQGETGCGKGTLAMWLHSHSSRAGNPVSTSTVPAYHVNCWRASCSAMKGAPSPGRSPVRWGCWKSHIAAPYSWTRLAMLT